MGKGEDVNDSMDEKHKQRRNGGGEGEKRREEEGEKTKGRWRGGGVVSREWRSFTVNYSQPCPDGGSQPMTRGWQTHTRLMNIAIWYHLTAILSCVSASLLLRHKSRTRLLKRV